MNLRFFKKRDEERQKKQKELLKDYEKGKVLQVDNQVNNKEYFKELENDKPKENQ